jgi:hypothetical protein
VRAYVREVASITVVFVHEQARAVYAAGVRARLLRIVVPVSNARMYVRV